jgi:hypothetical protein
VSEQAAESGSVHPSAGVVRNNPNATVALTSGSGLGAVVWICGFLGMTVPPEAGAAIGGLLAAAFLFVGRNGLCGAWNFVLHGRAGGIP